MALTITVVGVALLAGYLLALLGLHASYSDELPVDEVHHVPAGGGWEVALHRVRPAPGTKPRGTPVLLAHGIAMCRRFWHMTEDTSLARYLSRRGHDVWIAEYRGYAASRHTGEGDRPWDFALDHHILEDAPALIDHVRAQTGVDKVHWVGHSMGGIILYGYVQAFGTGKLSRVITIGSPSRMKRVASDLRAGVARKLLPRGKRFPLYGLTRLGLPFCVYLKQPLLRPFCNPSITRLREIAQLFTHGVQDLSCRALRQFARWQATGIMELEDGSGRIEDAPRAIDVPFLLLAGSGDRLVPPRAALPAYELAVSQEKERRVFGAVGDPAPPLGHLDLITSDNGRKWVFPVIAEWLEREDGGNGNPARRNQRPS